MTQQTEIHTLAGAYALDALTEIERAAFARHVAECSSCAAEVAELTETASRLSAPAWELPPARLRDKVFAEVARTPQVRPGRVDRAATDRAARDVRTWRRRTALAVAAGVIALGGMGGVWAVQEQRVGDASRYAQQLEAAQASLATIAAAGDAEVKSAAVEGGRVTVAISPSQNRGVALLNDMPALSAGKVYQLWLIEGTNATSVGIMSPGQRTGATVLATIGSADTFGVSVEPEKGSPKPTDVVTTLSL